MPGSRKNITPILLAAFLFFIGAASSASAHATPITYGPPAYSVLESFPEEVKIYFSERIEARASNISIFAPSGESANNGGAATDPANQQIYKVGIKNTGNGTYTISWQVVSADDGHFTKGAYSFSVGKKTAVQNSLGQIQIQHLTSIPEAVTIWMELLGQAIILGALTLLLITRWELPKRFSGLIFAGISFSLAGSISYIVLKTFDLEQLRGSGFVATLKIFIQTTSGIFSVYRVILAVVFAVIFLFCKNKVLNNKKVSGWGISLLLLIFLMVLDRARVSHAAATHFYPAFSVFIHTIHLLAKEIWVGGLMALCFVFLPVVSRFKNASSNSFLFSAFSKLANVAFGVAGVTGMYVVWLDLKNFSNLFSTEWGARAILLLIFALALFLLRLFNQFSKDKRTVFLEMLTGVAFLFITSYLVITTPPYASDQYLFKKEALSQGDKIIFSLHPFETNQFLTTVGNQIGGGDSSLKNLTVALENKEKGVGPIAVPLEKRFPGGYVFSKDFFTLPGEWQVTITGQRQGAYDASANFSVRYPNEIDSSRQNPDQRSFGLFELILVLLSLAAAAVSIFLYRLGDREAGALAYTPKYFLASSAGFIILLLLVWFSYNNFVKSSFQKLCEANGNFWLQSVPMRNGVALSSDTVTGCTLNVGLNHFADLREYQYFLRPSQSVAELAMNPQKPVVQRPANISINISNVENGRVLGPVNDLTIEHDRIMHMIIIGEDLKTFAHIHPPFKYTFPSAGRYTVALNYYVRAKQFVQQFFVDVAGAPKMSRPTENFSRDKNFEGYRVIFSAPMHIKSGVLTKLSYYFEKDGKPVTDFEPYLAAAMHLGIIDSNLQGFIHAHGEIYLPGSAAIQRLFSGYVNYHNHFVPGSFGPRIQARVTFPRPGIYQIFGEVKHQGEVLVTSFLAKVE